MKVKHTVFLILIAVVLSTCVQIHSQPTQAQVDDKIFLPLVDNEWPFDPSFGVEMQDFSLVPKAQAAGNSWVRVNALLWSDVQPNHAGQWFWDSSLEADLISASQAGMEVILMVRSTPTWAQMFSGLYCGPIKSGNFADFANFMKKVVERYSKPPYNVTYFEIWNEPDGPYAFGNPNQVYGCWGNPNDDYYGGGYYGQMLKVIYPAMKQANTNAQLVVGGLLLDCDPRQLGQPGYCDTNEKAKLSSFFEGMLLSGAGPYFDVMNFHGYPPYVEASSVILSERLYPTWSANGGVIEGKLDYVESMMALYGLDKPVMLTETGLLTKLSPTSDFQAKKANFVVWLFARNLARGIKATTWYTLDGPGWRNGGLLDQNQDPLPAYEAYSVLTSALADASYMNDLFLGTGIIGFDFYKGNHIWVLFSEDGSPKTITVPTGFSHGYDLFGNPLTVTNGEVTFSRPIYLEFYN